MTYESARGLGETAICLYMDIILNSVIVQCLWVVIYIIPNLHLAVFPIGFLERKISLVPASPGEYLCFRPREVVPEFLLLLHRDGL